MNDKKIIVLKCWLRVFITFAVISFGWLVFLWMGMSAGSAISDAKQAQTIVSSNSAFAERLIVSDLFIFFFSAVFGFSSLIFNIKSMSAPAKRSLHVIVNYVAALICFYGLHSSANEVAPKMWITLFFLATFVYFIIYGIAALVMYFVNKAKN